jgi:hypothetical protein
MMAKKYKIALVVSYTLFVLSMTALAVAALVEALR